MRNPPRLLLFTALAFGGQGCGSPSVPTPAEPTTPAPTGEGPFLEGCPTEGRALARVIGVPAVLPGKAAVGTAGDLLLANTRAAFVITDVDDQATYWYYGGALADAVSMSGCDPSEDKLDDLGLVLAEIDLGGVEQSVVRAFEAETVEVLADGADGGPAIVRATGTDAVHWLVEHTLINEAVVVDGENSRGRPMSGPFGTRVVVDYILAPDSEVLQVDLTVENVGEERFNLVGAALFSWGETLRQHAYASDVLDLLGFRFASGIPWVLATDGAGAYAWSMPEASMATISLSGVNVFVDIAQLTRGFDLAPGEARTLTHTFVVGDGAGATVVEPLLQANPVPMLDQPATPGLAGGVVRSTEGAGVGGATVRLEARSPGGEWGTLDEALTGDDGAFRFVVPQFEHPWEFQVVATHPGRDNTAPVGLRATDELAVELSPAGTLAYTLVDDAGASSPARIVFVRDDGHRVDRWLHGTGVTDLPPGTWSWTATRGFEHAPVRGEVVVPPDGEGTLSATLVHVVDTVGWMSIDTHVHTSDSPDSDVPQAVQLTRAAAHGLEVVVHTEHENIVDRRPIPSEVGIDAWVTNLVGEEVTSVAIEHMTMFPAEPDGSPRGGYVEWYGLGIEDLFGAMRTRSGGGVNLINHPGYLARIGWDRVAAAPTLPDPTLLGHPPGAALWSWNLDGMEVMNGHGAIWAEGGNGRFDDWASMLNAGHRLVGVGCSDDHGGNEVGFPRSYFASPTELPSEVLPEEVVDAFHAGALQASAGAFARVSVEEAGPGDLVAAPEDGWIALSVHLEAIPEVDVSHFVVLVNCDQADSVLATDPGGVVKYSDVLPLQIVGDSYVVVAAFGTTTLPLGMPTYDPTRLPRVLTNAIYVDGDGDGAWSGPGGRVCTYDLDVGLAR